MPKGKFTKCEPETFFCIRCKECKTEEHFSKNKSRISGLNSRCKECDREYLEERRKNAG